MKSLAPTGFTLPPSLPTVADPTFDATGFFGVLPGTTLSLDLQALNDFVPQAADAQLLRVTLLAVAGSCSPLDAHDVLVLVPPVPAP